MGLYVGNIKVSPIIKVSDSMDSITNYLKKPLISFSCEVLTGETLNLSMGDYDDALFDITGKHFNYTSYNPSTGTWTSNDGTLTLTVFKDYLNLYSHESADGGRFFDRPVVFALYGYFQDWNTGGENEVLGIYLSNDNSNIPTGTSLCIGATELYQGADGGI